MYTKTAIILFISILLSNLAIADGPGKTSFRKVIGYVFDSQTNEPLEGAMIQLDDQQTAVYADTNGRFEIAAQMSENTHIVVKSISYKTQSVQASLNTSMLVLKLQEED
jgi:hypothetical protein